MGPKIFKALKYGTPVLFLLAAAWIIWAPPARIGYAPVQPIDYRHDIHAGAIGQKTFDGKEQYGIDCQYCHTGVTTSKKAGVPSMNTCMNCHILVGSSLPGVKTLKKFYAEKKAVEWVRIHNVPDHVRFPHAPHIKQLLKEGQPTKTACIACHGDVSSMKVVEQKESLNMGFCVNCHRDYRNDVEYKKHGVSTTCNTCHY
ncbi:MAG: Menaquinone reductase, multiheme cytochrome c subunit [Turneriella sp.]|nr:Menaquinone reductase, multiheme cytochrome c subunit [Turneriella sp.]